MNLFTKIIPIEDYITTSLIYWRKYFPTGKNKFHFTNIKSHSHGNFSYSELYVAVSLFRLHGQFLTLCRGSLKRTDKCLIKRTKIEKKLKTGF